MHANAQILDYNYVLSTQLKMVIVLLYYVPFNALCDQ